MGIVKCKVHGETGIKPFIDRKIIDMVVLNYQGLLLEKNIEKKIFLVTEQCIFDETESFNINYYIAEMTMRKNKLKQLYIISSDEEEDEFHKIIPQTSGTCGKCFEEYIEKYNIEIIKEW